jgi:TRAP-type C4-dicarboxylate transport system substrate-binding protein
VVYRRLAWYSLPDTGKKGMIDIIEERAQEGQLEIRKMDDKIYQRLLTRGYKGLTADNEAEWWEAGRQLRRRLIGRIYTQELVERAESIALKYADKNQLANWKK